MLSTPLALQPLFPLDHGPIPYPEIDASAINYMQSIIKGVTGKEPAYGVSQTFVYLSYALIIIAQFSHSAVSDSL